MDRISQFIHPVAQVAIDATVAEVQNLFAQVPSAASVVVCDDARVVGVVLRETMMAAADVGQALADLVQHDCRFIDAEVVGVTSWRTGTPAAPAQITAVPEPVQTAPAGFTYVGPSYGPDSRPTPPFPDRPGRQF